MGGFRGTFQRVPTTATYKLGILITAGFMVLLPFVYMAVIALVAWGVYWHLTHNHVMLTTVRGRGAIFMFIAYLAPAVVGGIMTVFMIKPFFARASDEGRTRSLTPTSDPLLFEFVAHICQLVGAPLPKRIDVNCDINAAAKMRNGWWSLLGNDMVLLIGLPLAAGLSLQQFAGVLAHEFGHFSQGFGMRLTYIIRTINFWFMRVVYERDSWDDWLQDAAGSVDLRIGWVLYLAMAGVWVSRRILWCLMIAGHFVAGFMLREMEFDADRYEARLAGSDTFASTCRQLNVLQVAWQAAQHDLGSYSREGRLADNLPKLLMANLRQLPKDVYGSVDQMIAESKTGRFDTHPADKDRIASAFAEQAPGVFSSDLPATALFGQFDLTARYVTEDFYRGIFGPEFRPTSMHPTDALLARSAGEQSKSAARERFFAGAFCPLRPLRLPNNFANDSRSGNYWKEELIAARTSMQQLAPACRQAAEQFDNADTNLINALQARCVLSTGIRPQIDELKKLGNEAAAAQTRQHATITLGRLGNQLENFEEAAGRRLRAAMYLLEIPSVTARVPEGDELLREARQLWPLATQISNVHASLMDLRNTNAEQAALLAHIEGNNRNDSLIHSILDHSRRLAGQLTDLKNQFAATEYPFDHADGSMSVGHFLLQYVPASDQVGELFDAADSLGRKLTELNLKVINRLCHLAEAVETALQLPPLPSPDAAASAS
jgi:hypothetical protein